MCPRCSATMTTKNLDEEVAASCWRCGYVQYTPVREGWFEGDELLAGAPKARYVALPQAQSIRKRKPITVEFVDENGNEQSILITDNHIECTCKTNWDSQCNHSRYVRKVMGG